ncbi:MAG TPA: glycosyltransferase family 9 protein [Gemmataceae bacterium]|nr:glycosyltransferase family 9 protein [Gemmataceae bacterium]
MPVRQITLDRAPERIALIKPSALGDIIHSLPVLTALRRRFPAAQIAWIVNRSYAPLLTNHPDLNEIIPFDRGALKTGFIAGGLSFARFLRDLRKRQFDLVIDLQGLLRTGLMTLATRAPLRVGLASAREGASMCYTHRVDDRNGVTHAVDRYWRVVEAIGESSHKSFHVPIQADARVWAREQLQSFPRPWLAVGVGSRWLTKRWPPEHFADLARLTHKYFGGTAIFVGAPEESALADQSAATLAGPVARLTGKTTLPQLVALLAECDAMIANDTGPLHLAVALGRPVVAPYTCTLIEKTGPFGQSDRAVSTSIWCRGSYLKTCPRMECMAELTPDRLWPKLEAILRTWQQQPHAA